MSDQFNVRVVVEGLDHPEGVCVDAAGTVYAGGEAGQVYRIDLATGSHAVVAETGGFVLGLCADGHGILYACDAARHEVVRIDPGSGVVEVFTTGTPDRPLRTPNYPAFDDVGNLYVTDSGDWKADNGCVYRVAPGGETTVWSEEAYRFPNGVCLSADGTELLVVESLLPGLSALQITADGAAGQRRVVAELPDCVPDGVVLDADGNAYVTCYRPDRVYRVSRSGDVDVVADDPEGTALAAPTNGVFVGDALDTLLLANLGRWHLTAIDLGVQGLPLRFPTVRRGR